YFTEDTDHLGELAVYKEGEEKHAGWGIVSSEKGIIFKPEDAKNAGINYIKPFEGHKVARYTKEDDSVGLINKEGKVIVDKQTKKPVLFDTICKFDSEGIAAANLLGEDGQLVLINDKGEIVKNAKEINK